MNSTLPARSAGLDAGARRTRTQAGTPVALSTATMCWTNMRSAFLPPSGAPAPAEAVAQAHAVAGVVQRERRVGQHPVEQVELTPAVQGVVVITGDDRRLPSPADRAVPPCAPQGRSRPRRPRSNDGRMIKARSSRIGDLACDLRFRGGPDRPALEPPGAARHRGSRGRPRGWHRGPRRSRSKIGERQEPARGRYWDRTSDFLGVNEALSR